MRGAYFCTVPIKAMWLLQSKYVPIFMGRSFVWVPIIPTVRYSHLCKMPNDAVEILESDTGVDTSILKDA